MFKNAQNFKKNARKERKNYGNHGTHASCLGFSFHFLRLFSFPFFFSFTNSLLCFQPFSSGTTATVCLIEDNYMMHIGHVGDSRAILYRYRMSRYSCPIDQMLKLLCELSDTPYMMLILDVLGIIHCK